MLYYCGRIDLQIKLHGYRIEIEDIENNLLKLPDVQKAAVVPNYRENGEVRSITAYLILKNNVPETPELVQIIRKQLGEYIPEYMIPKKIRILETLPMTANGKVDRKALGGVR